MKTETMEIAPGVHRFVHKECRTVTGRTCKCCGKYLSETAFALFMMHDNGSQYVVVGFQCLPCDKASCDIWYPYQTLLGTPFRLRQLGNHEWVVHERHGDHYGALDVALDTIDDCDTEQEAMEKWRERKVAP